FVLMLSPAPTPPSFPYTTLFRSGFAQLPLYLEERRAVVFFGMPPYTFWQRNPEVGAGRIPPHRTDTGVYLVSEVFGARSMIFIKRSEEHTSELQSREILVCRLLLEKKTPT